MHTEPERARALYHVQCPILRGAPPMPSAASSHPDALEMRWGFRLQTDHFAYHRYISPLAEEFSSGARVKVKVLEIGLGCYQGNTGAGVRMWNEIFKNTQGRKLDLHVVEYDAECAHLWARKWAKRFHHINLRMFTGDQSNEAKLMEILTEGRGEYDAIVDDGGHTMLQQQVSLRVLFPALKPGGFCKRHWRVHHCVCPRSPAFQPSVCVILIP